MVEIRSGCSTDVRPLRFEGQLFDIVKKRRKRNVDGEVLAN